MYTYFIHIYNCLKINKIFSPTLQMYIKPTEVFVYLGNGERVARLTEVYSATVPQLTVISLLYGCQTHDDSKI